MDEIDRLARARLDALTEQDAETRARVANQLVSWHQGYVNELAKIRRTALGELSAQGRERKDLADMLGVTVTRVGQLLTSGPSPERALIGTGPVTVAIGGKWETRPAAPSTVEPSAVISAEALAAYHAIAQTCGVYGLEATYEVVPPPGITNLNRANLVVMTSPRLVPLVGQVLESDTNLGFCQGAKGWYLTDHVSTTTYRSPSDQGEAGDFAYLGRLPRPDGKGTFLYLAGIHAMGTLGAATYLSQHVADLYQQVKGRRWSVLVECRYDPDSRAIQSTELVTPIYIASK